MYGTIGMSHVQNTDFLKKKKKIGSVFAGHRFFFFPVAKIQGEQPAPVVFFQHTLLSLHRSASEVHEPANQNALCM